MPLGIGALQEPRALFLRRLTTRRLELPWLWPSKVQVASAISDTGVELAQHLELQVERQVQQLALLEPSQQGSAYSPQATAPLALMAMCVLPLPRLLSMPMSAQQEASARVDSPRLEQLHHAPKAITALLGQWNKSRARKGPTSLRQESPPACHALQATTVLSARPG